ncbi:MAG TPA: hypothetical protein VGH06_03800 [Candidatus Udaeobacter sp.]
MWRLAYVAFLTISLFNASAYAQALAPSTLGSGSHDQKAVDDIVQVITEKSARETASKPVHAITKKHARVAKKNPTQPVVKESAPTIAKDSAQTVAEKPQVAPKSTGRTFALEPVRPMNQPTVNTTKPSSRFSFRTAGGKTESVPVVTQYYPNRIIYPLAKVDKHIDSRLVQAATLAQERAHAHSRSRCWHYVKDALLASGVIDSRPKTELARDAASELVSNYGFKRLSVTDPFAAPVGSVLVYGTARSVGHVELRTKDGFVSDFRSPTPSRRPLMGVYAKL